MKVVHTDKKVHHFWNCNRSEWYFTTFVKRLFKTCTIFIYLFIDGFIYLFIYSYILNNNLSDLIFVFVCWNMSIFPSSPGCLPSQFECQYGVCIEGILRCDHIKDCQNALDEMYCGMSTSSVVRKQCINGSKKCLLFCQVLDKEKMANINFLILCRDNV